MGVKSGHKRRMDELRVEESFKRKSTKSRLKWAGYMDRMEEGKTGKQIRCPESGGKEEPRKIENAMGGLR